jgi:hypothetical protein
MIKKERGVPMIHEVVFDSVSSGRGESIGLACGYVSLNQITFINEKIIVNIEAKTGAITFCDLASNELLSTTIETPASGDDKYSEVACSVEGEQIKLGFPQYTYKDNYPHCDGESDRWTKIVSGFRYLCYDYKRNCIVK